MEKNSQHEFEYVEAPQKEESQFIVPREKQSICKELGELGPVFHKIKSTPEYPSWAQMEKAKSRLLDEIKRSRGSFITTIKDRISSTDSLAAKCIFYLALIVILTILAAGAFFVFQHLTSAPAEAAVRNFITLLA
jgi:hypothetical protein